MRRTLNSFMLVTSNILTRCLDVCDNPDSWVDPINETITKYIILDRYRLCAFLAQTGYESGYFNNLEENLNYSAPQLEALWPKIFPPEIASRYEHQPVMIANRAYANRLGNGTEESGDGWRYRGRGLLQITGKSNYEHISKSLEIDCVMNPGLLTQPWNAAMSAGQYWADCGLNSYADKQDLITITRKINGGLTGYTARLQLYRKCLQSVSDNST